MAAFMTVKQLANETGWDEKNIRAYAMDSSDPLPIHYVKGRERGGVVIVEEVSEWIRRNSRLYSERRR
jgi:hypothetical protein